MKIKLGWVVGVNVAAACLLMQGCKANRVRTDSGNEVKTIAEAQPQTAPAPTDDIKVADAPAPAVQPAPAPAVQPAPAVVPEATAPVQTAPAAGPEFTWYTVKPGDMLSKISKRYNIRQKAILDMNPGLTPNKLFAGKKIKLPGNVATGEAAPAAAPASAAPAAAAPASADAASVKPPKAAKAAKYTGATKTYVVKNGDSLGKIAQENGTNVRTLKELNGLKKDRVLVGQKLKVPAEKVTEASAEKTAVAPAKKADAKGAAKPFKKKDAAKKCTCAPGTVHDKPCACGAPDCKCKVAEKKDAPAAAPAAATDAAPAAPAQPSADAAASQASAPAPAEASAPAQQPATLETHTVKDGEDIVSIAISYGVSPSALMDANDLKSSEVKPGDVLKIPAKNAQ